MYLGRNERTCWILKTLSLIQKWKEEEIETIFIGKEFTKVSNKKFINTDDFFENIGKYNLKDRTILVKGSRGIRLENHWLFIIFLLQNIHN